MTGSYHYNWSGKKILIVEDDLSGYIYMSELLKSYNAGVSRNINGLDAFFSCMNFCPDIVLMDMILQGLNGFEATRLIKKYKPQLPVIAVTACAMKEDRLKCLNAGCDAYVTKPVMPAEILPLVDFYLTAAVATMQVK